MQGHVQTKFLLDDCHQHVDADGDPDLRFYGALVGTEKRFDAQMLLDPFEKQLDLPATFVELSDDQSGKLKIVGEEAEPLFCLFRRRKRRSADTADSRRAILRL